MRLVADVRPTPVHRLAGLREESERGFKLRAVGGGLRHFTQPSDRERTSKLARCRSSPRVFNMYLLPPYPSKLSLPDG